VNEALTGLPRRERAEFMFPAGVLRGGAGSTAIFSASAVIMAPANVRRMRERVAPD
jgi:hypothetical protein